MDQLLKTHQIVHTKSGTPCTIEALLGSGGQGEVYRVRLGNETMALKWYYPSYIGTDRGLRNRLQKSISMGAPNEHFLWPLELVEAEESDSFGYLMPIRDSLYKGIVDLMKGRVNPNFRELVTACYQLSDSFLQIHSRGYCYQDISFGNVFFDPDTGDILICDNDNVVENGNAEGGILGTPRFMAPEIVRGDSKPNTDSDLFSLAVLMFYMLMIHHPLEGNREASIKCLDRPAQNKIYGTEPIYIYDPQDDSNRPVPGYHDNVILYWSIYPQFLKDLFEQTFTEGMNAPQKRVRESQWRQAMIKLRDSIMYCGSCGSENFYDEIILKATGGRPTNCWSCRSVVSLPPRIRIDNRNVVMLNNDTQLFPHHLGSDYDFSAPVAKVSQHPTDPSRWGLKNLSLTKWTITTSGGEVNDVEPGRNCPLAVGTKVNFGRVEGEFRL